MKRKIICSVIACIALSGCAAQQESAAITSAKDLIHLLSKGTITEITITNGGNRSSTSTRNYDEYREYDNDFVSVYSRNTADTEWKQKEV